MGPWDIAALVICIVAGFIIFGVYTARENDRAKHVHVWGQWEYDIEHKVFGNDDRRPIRIEHFYKRVCEDCGEPEEKIISR